MVVLLLIDCPTVSALADICPRALWLTPVATFLASDQEGSRTLVRRLDLKGGGWTTLRSEPATVEFHDMPRDESFLVASLQCYARPADFYLLGADFAPHGRLITIEPRLDGRDLGAAETLLPPGMIG